MFAYCREEEPPPSYEEALGMMFNHSGASTGAATNHTPPSQPTANQRPPRARRTNSQEPIATASPDSGNLYYLDFIPHMDFRQPTETFECVYFWLIQTEP